MLNCINNFEGFCIEFDDFLDGNFCEICDESCPFYKPKQEVDNK